MFFTATSLSGRFFMLGLQTVILILSLKFSREFCRFLTIKLLLLGYLAKNSLENFKEFLNTGSCKCLKKILRAGYLFILSTKHVGIM